MRPWDRGHGGTSSCPRLLVVALGGLLAGCGSDPAPPPNTASQPAASAFDTRPPTSTVPRERVQQSIKQPAKQTAPAPEPPAKPRSLADLAPQGTVNFHEQPSPPRPPEVADDQIRPLGIRKLTGRHLVLFTDLPSSPSVDELPRVFDLAVPHWRAYFSIPEARTNSWQVNAYLMQDKQRFQNAGLLPADLPQFLHGFQRLAELWLYEQPSDYYRRHLLLHEGTHAWMEWAFGGAGPPWYMEGIAEFLATHRWLDGQLTLGYFPRDKKEVPEWGRIKIIKDDVEAGRARSLMEVMNYDAQAHLRLEPYGWCWAAAAFFDHHPVYQERFRRLPQFARDGQTTFNERFVGWFREDAARLWREWQWFLVNVDYGYDVAREAFQQTAAAPLPAGGSNVEIAAHRGWQSTGVQLEAGKTYRIQAGGRYQIGTEPKTWWSEPNGVTIRYHRGQPLGILLGTIVDESNPEATDNGFLSPLPIGSSAETTPSRSGTLYLRINDAPSELHDNQGTASVQISPGS